MGRGGKADQMFDTVNKLIGLHKLMIRAYKHYEAYCIQFIVCETLKLYSAP